MVPASSKTRLVAQLAAQDFLPMLERERRVSFTDGEAAAALQAPMLVTRAALRLLSLSRKLAMPVRGFYVVVPPDRVRLGCRPPEDFVGPLMDRLGEVHYVALRSAARVHGIPLPESFRLQVIVRTTRATIRCGGVEIAFTKRRNVDRVPCVPVSGRHGAMRVSSPEATALDLIGLAPHVAGLREAVAILSGLAPRLRPSALDEAASTAPLSWSQRLGFLLDTLGHSRIADPLARFVDVAGDAVPLVPTLRYPRRCDVARWRLCLNAPLDEVMPP